jgi:hypothetical protein
MEMKLIKQPAIIQQFMKMIIQIMQAGRLKKLEKLKRIQMLMLQELQLSQPQKQDLLPVFKTCFQI